ncbi:MULTISPECIES: PQQ-binding-like beta-propeller repeat protein [Halorussus]|uniref:outer membrane protein assembly factor BamB family protein n=1 Tax=Halorussus TaxID=1070314 RepID=UPI00209D1227|nr:PQQ-binding-like beta-propeller repeat protein [Halorussus vallis]USZ78069.1 PQQ-binding-like beta-propeller repeat protein [Halorussus vallis]
MRTRTLLAVVAVVLALGAVAAYGFVQTGSGGHLREAWVSDTARDMNGNHHAPAVAEIDGESWVFAPISGNRDTHECGLVALSGANGTTRWTYPIPPRNCTIHAVADPAVADLDGDGEVEVLAATTEKVVVAADPQTGEPVFRHNLTSYGYTQPLVEDFAPGGGREVIVADVKGRLFAIHANGTEAWNRSLGTTWANPALADFDADGEDELAVGSAPPGGGAVTLLEGDGTTAWRRTLDGSVGWLATGRVDVGSGASNSETRIVAATTDGDVVAYAGDGTRVWNHTFGRLAAVHAFGDGDGDGTAEVYAVDADGKLRALDAATGDVEWTTTLTTEDVQMTPPPALGDVDGDGSPELVAATNDGKVSVVDPTSGEVTATYRRDVPIFKYPVTADLDDDGDDEAVVTYGDGRVVALDYAE